MASQIIGHNPIPEKTVPLFSVHPSGVANTTGTPTTRRKDTTINANKANWKIKSIALISLKSPIFTRIFFITKFSKGEK